MTRFVLFLAVVLPLYCFAGHALAHGAAKSKFDDVRTHRGCAYCGMDRGQYTHSRVMVTYEDGGVTGLCSIRCLAIELKVNRKKPIRRIEVADFNTKKMINAESAYWVVGGKHKGVMTSTPKWAFADNISAEQFVNRHGGTLSNFQKVIAMAEKER